MRAMAFRTSVHFRCDESFEYLMITMVKYTPKNSILIVKASALKRVSAQYKAHQSNVGKPPRCQGSECRGPGPRRGRVLQGSTRVSGFGLGLRVAISKRLDKGSCQGCMR